ncbi:nuclear transport factor 2 family protein [Aliifodinibius sp. S!AR15-10]|uniref:nuclear transport factor 2 family protein n=1 Tax=Aliifodinibius sp. S!AR15-10 TaxID=2950437 RepID=UPI0028555CD1|nr:nuclear transport factor 2 family protein [Aliifodinibius sp. S!AR15-10]MDR8393266.1 nuclear transport factor 2 family protein [Aliifodinibius sp. S!AR15-10]
MESQSEIIEQLVQRLNDCWINDKLENLDMFFHKKVVMLEPGTNRKITGREEMVESYREFTESAKVSDFKINDMLIDIFDSTAVAFYTYRIQYQVENTKYDESGSEILVFNRHNDRWQIIWRTQEPSNP